MARGKDKAPRAADHLYRVARRYGVVKPTGKRGRASYGDIEQRLLDEGFEIDWSDPNRPVATPPPDLDPVGADIIADLDLTTSDGRLRALEHAIRSKLDKSIARDEAELIVKAVNAAAKIIPDGDDDEPVRVEPVKVDSPEKAREHEAYLDDLEADGRL